MAELPALTRRAAWALVLVATATMAVSYVDRQALAVLAPTVTRALDLSDARFGTLVSAFSLAYLVCTPLAGRFIDRIGAGRGLLLSVLVWSTVAGGHALVAGFGSLLICRVLLGAAESPSFPAAAQTVTRALPPTERGAGFGILFTGSSFGAMIAAPLATSLEARFGWRLAMLGTALVGLTWVPLWLLVTRGDGARRLLAPPPRRPGSQRASIVRLLAEPAVLRGVLAVLAAAPMATFVLNWGAKVLVGMCGLAQRDVGGFLFLPPLFLDLGAVGFGAAATLAERHADPGRSRAPHRILFATAALIAAGGALLGFARSPWEVTLVLSLSLGGAGGLFALLTADMLRRVDPALVATAGGLTAAAQSLAYIVANPLIGRASDRSHTFSGVAVALALWILPGAVLWIFWDPRPPVEQ